VALALSCVLMPVTAQTPVKVGIYTESL